MKLTKFLVPLLAVALLAGCGEEVSVDQLVVDAASEIGALVTNGRTGSPYSDRTMTINLASGDTLSATTKLMINQETLKIDTTNGVEVTITYAIDEATAENWAIAPGKPDVNHSRLAPKIFDFESYESVLTATIAYGTKTKDISWNISIAERGYELVVIKIGDVRSSELAVNAEFTTRGYVTGFFKDKNHVYAGASIADGDSAINLNRQNLGSLWPSGGYQIGDLILVTGKYSTYNGVTQIGPTEISMNYDYAEVDEPIDLVISTEAEWSADALLGMDSRVISMTGLVYVSGKDALTVGGSHVQVTVKYFTKTLILYINYHVAEAGQQEFIDAMADWVANETTFNYHGHLGWYTPNPQLVPFEASALS